MATKMLASANVPLFTGVTGVASMNQADSSSAVAFPKRNDSALGWSASSFAAGSKIQGTQAVTVERSSRSAATVPRAQTEEAALDVFTEEPPSATTPLPVSGSCSGSVRIPTVLTVAGSDSGGGAGIQADIKACAARGVFCTTAITALTAQNTEGVQGIFPVPPDFIRQQLVSVLADMGASVVKTGMLQSEAVALVLHQVLSEHFRDGLVVVDPVLVSTSGHALAEASGNGGGGSIVEALRSLILPLATIVTPNLREAEALLGLPAGSIGDVASMRSAAAQLHELGPRYVLVKGGHLPQGSQTDGHAPAAAAAGGGGGNGRSDKAAIDILFDGQRFIELSSPFIQTSNTHGTGCTLASAIAAELAKGRSVEDAVRTAKQYTTEILAASSHLQLGGGPQGPMDHFSAVPAAASERIASRAPSTSKSASLDSPRSRFNGSDLLLYAVTDPRMNSAWKRTLLEAVEGAIRGGATIVQIRDKNADTGIFLEEAKAVVELCRTLSVPLLINDRIDVALAVDADGVHIGQKDMPVAEARRLLGQDKIIGVSAKTPEQALAALEGGADYLGCGGVYPTNTKENNPTIGLAGLSEVCRSSPLPVVAIGGIKATNVPDVMGVAATCETMSGVAVVSGLFDQEDVAEATKEFLHVVDKCRGSLK